MYSYMFLSYRWIDGDLVHWLFPWLKHHLHNQPFKHFCTFGLYIEQMLKSQQKWKSNHLHKKHQRFEVSRSTMEAALKMRFGLFIALSILPVIAFVCEVLAAKTDLFHLKVKFLPLFIPFRWMKGPENCITLLAKNVQFNEVNDGGSKIFIRISISIAMASLLP